MHSVASGLTDVSASFIVAQYYVYDFLTEEKQHELIQNTNIYALAHRIVIQN